MSLCIKKARILLQAREKPNQTETELTRTQSSAKGLGATSKDKKVSRSKSFCVDSRDTGPTSGQKTKRKTLSLQTKKKTVVPEEAVHGLGRRELSTFIF